jgi:starch synthase
MKPLSVLSVTSEVFPIIKTGGLADVAGALPSALAQEGVTVVTLVPGYPAVLKALERPEVLHQYPGFFGGTARLLSGRAGDLDLFVIDAHPILRRTAGTGRTMPGVLRRSGGLRPISDRD